MMSAIGREKVKIDVVNNAARQDPRAFFENCNAHYEKRVVSVARRIRDRLSTCRIIMLSGPSASGKTTTSLKIRQALEELGVYAITISMDDYFKNRDEVPEYGDGSKDFESPDALDIDLLRANLKDLMDCGWAALPVFDFKSGERWPEPKVVRLRRDNVAIVEGIHALDPAIVSRLGQDSLLKLYVSVNTDFLMPEGEVALSAREARLIRRTIRDYSFRNSSPENTLDMWNSVCRGEDLYIRPYKKYADITINSVFNCEPGLFREMAAGLFDSVSPESVHYERARHLVNALSLFEKLPLELAPADCMLREFAGGSVCYD